MAYRRKLEKDIRCPLEYGMDVFGGRWKSRILCVLQDGALRYSELRGEMANVTDAALAGALRELQASGLVARRSFDEVPPRVEYSLTQKGESVIPLLRSICQWAGTYYRDVGDEAIARCKRCDYRG